MISGLSQITYDYFSSVEIGVGAPPSWDPLLETYFNLEALTAREHATPYRFKEDPEVGASYCDMHEDTENCDLVCEKILSGERHKTSKYCYKPNPPGFDHCWDTTKMKCWNSNITSQEASSRFVKLYLHSPKGAIN